MNFVDDVTLSLIAGNGGDGLVHLRREKYVPHGGPDGGDGGRGGSIYVEATIGRQTLAHLTGLKRIKATSGADGGVKKMSGHSGEDVVVDVPVGTVIADDETGSILYDLTTDGQRVCVVKGGIGGRGNWHFRSSTNQAPEEFEEGVAGERLTAHLTLKLLADIGLVGQPNAGKSTLINVLTNAKSRVGAYPFTTTNPHLGVLHTAERDIVIADIPGLIEGAAEGKGLGHQFLRHIERTSVISYLIPADSADPVAELQTLLHELTTYNKSLGDLPSVVVITKTDLTTDLPKITKQLKRFTKLPVIAISSQTHSGLTDLTRIWIKHLTAKV